jgi:APA family basic amino acid/polyamine antiporter
MPTLRRELGRWDLTAIGVNQVIGGAVFLMPAIVARQIGGWSWVAVAAVGILALLIALNFAEAGSRFDGTGGAYLYTRTAFGRFPGFQVGWMLWITRVTSWASVVNGLVDALGYYRPDLRVGFLRVTVISMVVIGITFLNIRGIRQSAFAVNLLTWGKLLPLAIFILAGLPMVSIEALRPDVVLTWSQVSTSALYLIFAYGGYEVVPVPAGEAKDPRSAVPFAMVMTIVVAGVIMTLAQVVALGTLPNLAASTTPLADASRLFLGAGGALLMTAGAVVSTTGNNVGGALSGSRMLFALSEQGDFPSVFARVSRRFQTPVVAIVVTSLTTLGLALSGSFATLAAVSAVARLIVYVGTCASVLALRRTGPAPFTIAGGPVVPVLALLISSAILAGASTLQLQVGGAGLVVGAALFFIGSTFGKGISPDAK